MVKRNRIRLQNSKGSYRRYLYRQEMPFYFGFGIDPWSHPQWCCRFYQNEENNHHRREYLHFVKKYNRYEKRHKNLAAHLSPCFIGVAPGDTVTVGQCRPLSKTVRFNVLKVSKNVVKGSKSFAKF